MIYDWDKLRIFYLTVAAGSFTRAGEQLSLSQSAVSRQISTLEEQVGTPLFHRHARGLLLTEQGEILHETAVRIYNLVDLVEKKLGDAHEKPKGVLRVTTTVGIGSSWLASRLNEFITRYPDIELQVLMRNEELDIGMREADVGLVLQEPTQPDLIRRKLFTIHFHVYASPGYTQKFGEPKTVEDLDAHRIITYGQNAPGYLRGINWLQYAGRTKDTPRRPILAADNVLAIKSAAENDIGLALLPDYLMEDGSTLKRLLSKTDVPSLIAYFVYPEELRNSKRVKIFRDFMISNARNWSF